MAGTHIIDAPPPENPVKGIHKYCLSWIKSGGVAGYTPFCSWGGFMLYVVSFLVPCVMYTADIVSDLLQAWTYYTEGDRAWALLTLCLVLLPGVVIGILSYKITERAWSNVVGKPRKRTQWFIFMTCLCLMGPVIASCVTLRKTGVLGNKTKALSSFEGLGEGIPQFTLQLYIIAVREKVTLQQCVTLSFSLVGTVMGVIGILFRNHRTIGWEKKYVLGGVFLSLSVTSRLGSIALFLTWYDAVYIVPNVLFLLLVVTCLMSLLTYSPAFIGWFFQRDTIREEFMEVARSRVEWLVTVILSGLFPVKMRMYHILLSSGCSTVAIVALLLVFLRHLMVNTVDSATVVIHPLFNETTPVAYSAQNYQWWNKPYSIQQYYDYIAWVLVATSVLSYCLSYVCNNYLQEVVSDFLSLIKQYPCIRNPFAAGHDGMFYVCCDNIVRQLDPVTLETTRALPVRLSFTLLNFVYAVFFLQYFLVRPFSKPVLI